MRALPPDRPSAAPIEPAAVTANATSATAVGISWTPRDPSLAAETPSVYCVRAIRGLDIRNCSVGTVAANVTRFTDQGLRPRKTSWYRARATDASRTPARLSSPTAAVVVRTRAAPVRWLRVGS